MLKSNSVDYWGEFEESADKNYDAGKLYMVDGYLLDVNGKPYAFNGLKLSDSTEESSQSGGEKKPSRFQKLIFFRHFLLEINFCFQRL